MKTIHVVAVILLATASFMCGCMNTDFRFVTLQSYSIAYGDD